MAGAPRARTAKRTCVHGMEFCLTVDSPDQFEKPSRIIPWALPFINDVDIQMPTNLSQCTMSPKIRYIAVRVCDEFVCASRGELDERAAILVGMRRTAESAVMHRV